VAVVRGWRRAFELLQAARPGRVQRAAPLRARAPLPRDAFSGRVEVLVQASRAARFAGAPDAAQSAERARLSDLRPRAARRRRRLVDLRVRRAQSRRRASAEEARSVGLPRA